MHGVVSGNEGFVVERRYDGGLDGEVGGGVVGGRGYVVVVTVFGSDCSFVDLKPEAGVG